MSLGCAQCGDCCDPVTVSADQLDVQQEWIDYWRGGGEDEAHGDVWFIATHMTELERDEQGRRRFQCHHFNQVTRQCEAYEQRPDMCMGFPWYGREPDEGSISRLPARCSFGLDVNPSLRNTDARPLIPLSVKR